MSAATASADLRRLRAQQAELQTDIAKQVLVVESLDRPGTDRNRRERALMVYDDMLGEAEDLAVAIRKASR